MPTDLTPYVIRVAHEACRHLKGPPLGRYLNRRFEWGHYFKAQQEIRKAHRGCVTCEKFRTDHLRRKPFRGAFVRRPVGVSVAVDVLKLLSTKWEGQTYDAVVLSTNRHSGWMVGYPTRLSGLTGQQVASWMFHSGGRDPMGIPSEVTSDRGPQLISQWWSTVCGQMGLRHAMAEVYDNRTNGSAERAGQVLHRCLNELHSQQGINWVEAFPQALRIMMDMPRADGPSPYRIVTGRDHPMGSIPHVMSRECVAATSFIERQRYVEENVNQLLGFVLLQHHGEVNSGRISKRLFKPRDKIWVRSPTTALGLAGDCDEFDVGLLGPCLVTNHLGEMTYEVQVGERSGGSKHCKTIPRRCLRPYKDDMLTGESLPLHYVQPKRC